MISDGVVRFTSDDTVTNGAGQTYLVTNPVVGAIVTWERHDVQNGRQRRDHHRLDRRGRVSHVQIERSY